MTAKTLHHLPYIDGLRAVAVLSVIVYHLHARWLPGGFTGVDIFFVISGYVVSRSVATREGTRLTPFLSYFYGRRLFRIAPALITCLLVTALAFAVLVPFSWLSGTNQNTGLNAFFGLSNFVLAGTDNDYFSPRVGFNPFTQTWSLAVEEQFYLIFPWVFLPFLTSRRAASSLLLAFAGLASWFWAWHLAHLDPGRAFYMLTSRFWELAAGVLLFQAQTRQAAALPKVIAGFGLWLSAGLLAAGLIFVAPQSTPFPGGMLPVLGTLGILGCLHRWPAGGPVRDLLEWRQMRYIGKISYSLYLWHWPVFVLLRWTCGLQDVVTDGVALAIVFVLAAASYRLVETPPRRWLPGWRGPQFVPVLVGLGALVAGYASCTGIWALQPAMSISTVTRHADDWYPDKIPPGLTNATCRLEEASFHITGGKIITYESAGCAAARPFPRQVFVIGDSHAAAYAGMAKLLALRRGAKIYLYASGGCSFIGLLNPESAACTAFEAAAVADARQRLRPGDVVFLPALRLPRLVDQYAVYGEPAARAQMFGAPAQAARRQGEAVAMPILQEFSRAGARVIFEAPTPVLATVPFRCADWYDRRNPICAGGDTMPRATIEVLRAPVLQVFAQFQQAVPAVSVWDPMAVLCPGPVCSAYRQSRPLFFDGDHLSGYGNFLLEPDFERFLAPPP